MRHDHNAIVPARDSGRVRRRNGIATAVGALAIGAAALGFIAIGRIAIGRMVLRSGHVGRLTIDDLTVRRLRVIETMRDAPPT